MMFSKRLSARALSAHAVCAVQRTERGYAYQVDDEHVIEVCVHRATNMSLVPEQKTTRYVRTGLAKGMIRRKVATSPAVWRLACHHCPTVAWHPAAVPGAVPFLILDAFTSITRVGSTPSVRSWAGGGDHEDRSGPVRPVLGH